MHKLFNRFLIAAAALAVLAVLAGCEEAPSPAPPNPSRPSVEPEPEPEPKPPVNRPPVVNGDGKIEWEFHVGIPHYRDYLDAAWYFRDPEGQPLTYRVLANTVGVVEIPFVVDSGVWTYSYEPTDSMFYVNPLEIGTAKIMMTATDPGGLSSKWSIWIVVQ